MADEQPQSVSEAVADFAEFANELLAGLTRDELRFYSDHFQPGGVRVPPHVWAAARMEVGPERFNGLLQTDKPALAELLRETWRRQRQGEEGTAGAA